MRRKNLRLEEGLNFKTAIQVLLDWFDENKRDLPWRKKPRQPYRVWVSEIMLQQTQVKTVIDYFNRWMNRFPDVLALSAASQDDVLKLWEGLGYYSRARNMHRAARIIVESHGGHFPIHARELRKLPGIGPYTAAAIASLCFNEKAITVDGNISRVTSRMFAIDKVVKRGDVEHLLSPLYRDASAGRINEALMELGALCCLPARPLCSICPLGLFCLAYQKGAVDRFPVLKKKKKAPHLRKNGLLILKGEDIFLRKRSDKEMLGGLWGIPLSEVDEESSPLRGKVRLEKVHHAYTHFHITVRPIVIDFKDLRDGKLLKQGEFVPLSRVSALALSGLDHKILQVLREYLAKLSA